MLKKIKLLAFLLGLSLAVNAGMLNPDGTPRPELWQISDVVKHCEVKGYFIYDKKLFMCTKIRDEVTKDEIRSYYTDEIEKHRLRQKSQIK